MCSSDLGEMEKTMFSAFCAKSTMHAAIERLSSLDEWKDSVEIIERSLSTNKGGSYIPETCILGSNNLNHIENPSLIAVKAPTSKLRPLDKAIQTAMKKSEKELHHELGYFHCQSKQSFRTGQQLMIINSQLTVHPKITASYSFKRRATPVRWFQG